MPRKSLDEAFITFRREFSQSTRGETDEPRGASPVAHRKMKPQEWGKDPTKQKDEEKHRDAGNGAHGWSFHFV